MKSIGAFEATQGKKVLKAEKSTYLHARVFYSWRIMMVVMMTMMMMIGT